MEEEGEEEGKEKKVGSFYISDAVGWKESRTWKWQKHGGDAAAAWCKLKVALEAARADT